MRRFLQQVAFVLSGTILRPPILLCLLLMGALGLVRTIFLVYPADESETNGFCPDVSILRRFFSGRPTLGGLIIQDRRPVGIYVVIPDTIRSLARRKNRALALRIVNRLRRLSQLTRAHSIGLAGQLGFVFEKRHGIPIAPPCYGSLQGSLFSLTETIHRVLATPGLRGKQVSIGILGQGDISQALSRSLVDHGLRNTVFELGFRRDGGLALRNENEVIPQLGMMDLLINMTPTGEDFENTRVQRHLSGNCRIVDFAHPGITADLENEIQQGNRVHRQGLHFLKSLPGDWQSTDIPACSLASLLATRGETIPTDAESFFRRAREQGFHA